MKSPKPKASKALPAYPELADQSPVAFTKRLARLTQVLRRHGKFSAAEASDAIFSGGEEVRERVAYWLRIELGRVRESEKTGQTTVRRRLTLSRRVISDIALTMIERGISKPGPNLTCLLQELLGVDRHRGELAATHSEKFEKALVFEAFYHLQRKKPPGPRQLARDVGTHASDITRWRRSKYKGELQVAIARLRFAMA